MAEQVLTKKQIKENWDKIAKLREEITYLKGELIEKSNELTRLLRETPLP